MKSLKDLLDEDSVTQTVSECLEPYPSVNNSHRYFFNCVRLSQKLVY